MWWRQAIKLQEIHNYINADNDEYSVLQCNVNKNPDETGLHDAIRVKFREG